MTKQSIVLGGGCFWCTEAIFKMLKGVLGVVPGYAGGKASNPTYEQVCNGTTGHAEVIKIDYDSSIVNLETLLTVFFASHDPTIPMTESSRILDKIGAKDRQGNDVGTQYRSIVLYENQEQKAIVEKFIADLNNSSEKGAPIVTEVAPLTEFYFAEDYHKNYYENNKNQPYCQVVINPKLTKVQQKFAGLLKTRD